MAGLLPALLAVAVVAEPDAGEAAAVARTTPGWVVVVGVDVDAAEVAVADIRPHTRRGSPTMQTTVTRLRFMPQLRSTTAMWCSAQMRLGLLADPTATTRDLMTAFQTTILAIALS